MKKILIADDHPVVRQGLKKIIAETESFEVAAEAGSGPEVLSAVRESDFDVVLLDLSMPGASGLDVLKQVKAEKPDLPVLILSVHSEEQYAVRALKTGASGYLSKSSATEELITAIETVTAGRKFITPTLSEKLVFHLQSSEDGKLPHEILSDREFEVLCLISEGKTVSTIARELFLSPKTVSTYRSRILEKMALDNNAELMRYAIQNNLVDFV